MDENPPQNDANNPPQPLAIIPDDDDLLDLVSLSSVLHRKILQKFDYETFAQFDESSSVANDICESNGTLLYSLETDKINFLEGMKTFTLNRAHEGQARIIAKVCVLPVNNPDFEENYATLLKNKTVIGLLMLRSSLRNMTLPMFDKLLQTLTVWRLSLEGKMGDNFFKSKEIYKLEKLITSQILTVTDELFLEMNEKAPSEVKFEKATLSPRGVTEFIKEYLYSKRTANLIQFPKIWNDLEEVKSLLKDFQPTELNPEETKKLVEEVTKNLLYRRPIKAAADVNGLIFSRNERRVNLILTDENSILLVFQ